MAYINLGNGLMEMNTDLLSTALTGLGQDATRFSTDWSGLQGRISAAEAGIGQSHSQDFRAGYDVSGPAMRKSAEAMKPNLDNAAGLGQKSIGEYVTKDAEHAARLRAAARRRR